MKSRIGMPLLRSVVLDDGAFKNCNLLRFEGMHSGGASLNGLGELSSVVFGQNCLTSVSSFEMQCMCLKAFD